MGKKVNGRIHPCEKAHFLSSSLLKCSQSIDCRGDLVVGSVCLLEGKKRDECSVVMHRTRKGFSIAINHFFNDMHALSLDGLLSSFSGLFKQGESSFLFLLFH
ncbi:hypothetical protein CEXT_217281 [Caerostris extrusa]|uniref:Uncharacterized protein n=1 Tax=Caerostris extrusa TaxID=172846 RepID=A0AAV4YA65_CAEEX|nr:hypothetical protein CEXT_217281 [Caerostris extrusa]